MMGPMPVKCNACGCHTSFHKLLPSMLPNSVVKTIPSLEGDIMLIDDNDECLKEPLTKKLKLNEVVFNVKLEFFV